MVRAAGLATTTGLWLSLLLLAPPGRGQQRTAMPAASTAAPVAPGLGDGATAAVVRTLRGRVVNALDGTPIPRALVTVNALRPVLTDAQGHYEIAGFSDTQASLTITKPGYSASPDDPYGLNRTRVRDLDAVTETPLYPDAILTGTVTGGDGQPLSRVQVTLRRAQFDPGGFRWQPVRSVQTNSRGEYRFRETPGSFQVSAGYVERSADTGEAVLPVTFPEGGGRAASAGFDVKSGEERRVDLRPRTGPVFPVRVHVSSGDGARGFQLSVTTAQGETFSVGGGFQGDQGEGTVSLPRGTYSLTARMGYQQQTLMGTTRVTVTGKNTDVAEIHLEPLTSLPLELAIDTAGQSSTGGSGLGIAPQAPDVRNFNLRLTSLRSTGTDYNSDVAPQQRDDKTYEFRVPPGEYRLMAFGSGGQWAIESATYGTADLVTGHIQIGSGSESASIRLLVKNSRGMLSATVRIPDSFDRAWLYVVPKTPRLTAIQPMMLTNGSGATQATISMSMPEGTYSAYAFDKRLQVDFRDPEQVAKLPGIPRTVEVTNGATTSVTLDAVPAGEVKP